MGKIMLGMLLVLALFALSANCANGTRKIICVFYSSSIYRYDDGSFSVLNINPNLCTHIIYSSAQLNSETYTVDVRFSQDVSRYKLFNSLKHLNPNLKTMLGLGLVLSEAASYTETYIEISKDKAKRKNFTEQAVNLLKKYNFDGLHFFWSPANDSDYISLLSELKSAFHTSNLILGMSAGYFQPEEMYEFDVVATSKLVDYMEMRTFALHSSSSDKYTADHPSRLYPKDGDTKENQILTVDGQVRLYLNHSVSKDKLVISVSSYGKTWKLANALERVPPAPADGPGHTGLFVEDIGVLPYYEICMNSSYDPWFEDYDYGSPYSYSRYGQWVGYDNVHSMDAKAKYVKENNLAGVMLFDLSGDDFKGKFCKEGEYPLLNALNRILG